LLGIDLGTSGCKAAVFNTEGRCLASAGREYATLHPQPGWSELDARDVWANTQEVIGAVAAATHSDPITALCVSSMGEAVVPLSRNREILGASILSSDVRGKEYAEGLRKAFGEEELYRINPNTPGPQYSLPKMLWLRDNDPGLFERTELFLLWGDAVGYLLGGDAVCNNSLANRTLLFDVERNDWSDALLEWSGVPRECLGRIVPGGNVAGTVADSVADRLGLPRGVVIVSGGHDQCCNALGCGCTRAGQAACGIGSYQCIAPVFAWPRDPLRMLTQRLNIEHHVVPDLYIAFLFNQAGLLVRWFRDTFVGRTDEGSDRYARLMAEMPAEPTRLLVLPHFDPPQWPAFIAETSGIIMGLRSDTSRGEILKGIIEGATLYFAGTLDALRAMGMGVGELVASGGGAKSDAWLQITADALGVPVVRPATTEGGLAGTAMLAGMATGVYATLEDATGMYVARERVFEPDETRHARYREKAGLLRQLYPVNRGLLEAL
jgi:xylulokinase